MFTKAKFMLAITAVACFIFIGTAEKQKPQWKGKIEYEDGIKVIKNPRDPLYGEIEFDLEEDLSIGNEEDENYMFYRGVGIEVDSDGNIFVLDGGNYRIQKFDKDGNYLQTIGRKGQGPGEFQRPIGLYLDSKGNIYVIDVRKIHIFNEKNEFVKTITAYFIFHPNQFGITEEGNIWGYINVHTPEGNKVEVAVINSNGEKLETIASFSDRVTHIGRDGIPIVLSTPYDPELYFCPLNEEQGIYGYSSEYKLAVVKSSGEIAKIIKKEESPEPITRKEKNRLIDRTIESYRKRERKISRGVIKKALKFPKYKPFFMDIKNDDEGNIYVMRKRSGSSDYKGILFDLFNQEGYYLYKVKIPNYPLKIENGYIYSGKYDKKTGYNVISRYKIKNWEQIKEGIKS